MTTIVLDVISDTVCPWCFIAYKTMWKGIALYQNQHKERGDSFIVDWHPFQLNPHFPPGYSLDKQEYYLSKYGAARTNQIHESLNAYGQPLGINFKFGGMTGSSFDSHRLVVLAKQKSNEMQNKVVGAIFKAFFEQEQNIADLNVLVTAAKTAGLDEEDIRSWLNDNNKGADEVTAGIKAAMSKGVRAVPNVTMQKSIKLESIMGVDQFVSGLEKLHPSGTKA